MAELGLICLFSNSGIFYNKEKNVITIVYVNNILFIGSDRAALLKAKE